MILSKQYAMLQIYIFILFLLTTINLLLLATILYRLLSYKQSGDTLITPLVRLLAVPERYDGKEVTTVGYVVVEFENNSLSMSETGYGGSIWLDLPIKHPTDKQQPAIDTQSINKQYVMIKGVFTANNHGHLNMFQGSIRPTSAHAIPANNKQDVTMQEN